MVSNHEKRYWQKPPVFSPTKEQERQAKKFNVHPLIIYLLGMREVSSDDDIDAFLNPNLANLPEPFIIKGMKKAVCLVSEAIVSNSEIVIWGDYDVDGITATSLLVHFFNKIGKEVRWKIPDRFSEGYGLNSQALKEIRTEIQGDSPLLITVDCGISNHGEILQAKNLGFQIIVTDHHEPPDTMVEADAVINVKQKDCGFPDSHLAGVGTAFYLAAGIRSYLKSEGYFHNEAQVPNLKQFLDYVAIGTIADMVPLTGANRILVKGGFESLSSTGSVGLSALLKSSDIMPGTMTSDDISFQLAPKINAAGRMGRVDAAMDLLLCSEEDKAFRLATKLTEINTRRKRICETILESTLNIDSNVLITDDICIILSGEFHSGVIGIVASQLVNMYHLPVIIFAPDPANSEKTILKGSGRSVPGIDLMAILRSCDRYLLKYGGHTMAAGMSLYKENLAGFKGCFSAYLSELIQGGYKKDLLFIDSELPLEKVFESAFLQQLYRLEPFGMGNARPIFSDSGAFIYDYQSVGRNGDHLKIFFRGRYTNRQGVGFNLGHKREILQQKRNHTVIYSPTLNRYKTNMNWEVRLLDII
jgi:single-stranded-DNA-specific exonuclease